LAGGEAGHGEPALFLVGAGAGPTVDVVVSIGSPQTEQVNRHPEILTVALL
jgi:hypothetical protein